MSTDTAFNRHCRRKLRRLSGHPGAPSPEPADPRHLRRPRGACAAAQPHAGAGLGVLVHRAGADVPADLLGEAYWDDCFGGPLGDFAAGSLPRPEHLSYAPEADQFLAELEKLAAQEEVIEAAEAEQAEAEQSEKES